MKVVVYEIISVSTSQTLLDLLEKDETFTEKSISVEKSYKPYKQPVIEPIKKQQRIQCKVDFTISESEKKWMLEKELSLPKRCRDCRIKNKEMK